VPIYKIKSFPQILRVKAAQEFISGDAVLAFKSFLSGARQIDPMLNTAQLPLNSSFQQWFQVNFGLGLNGNLL